jgi:hypothetical protein
MQQAVEAEVTFESFWIRYPRRMGKGAARRMYERAIKIASHDDIMTGLERFIEAEPWHGELKYCPHPATWLFQERWEDDYAEEENPLRHMTFEQRREWSRMNAPKLVRMK